MSSVLQSIKMSDIKRIKCDLENNSSEIAMMQNMMEEMMLRMELQEERFRGQIKDLQLKHEEEVICLRKEIENLKKQNSLAIYHEDLKEIVHEKKTELSLKETNLVMERVKRQLEDAYESVADYSVGSWEMKTKTIKYFESSNSKKQFKETENKMQCSSMSVQNAPLEHYQKADYAWVISKQMYCTKWMTNVFWVGKYPYSAMAKLKPGLNTEHMCFKLFLSFVDTFNRGRPLIEETIPQIFFIVKAEDGSMKCKGTFHLSDTKAIEYNEYFLEETFYFQWNEANSNLLIEFYAEPIELTNHIASRDGCLTWPIHDYSTRRDLATTGIESTYDLPFIRTPGATHKVQTIIYVDAFGLLARFGVYPSKSKVNNFIFNLVNVTLYDPSDETNFINVTKNFRENEVPFMELATHQQIQTIIKGDILNIKVAIISEPPLSWK